MKLGGRHRAPAGILGATVGLKARRTASAPSRILASRLVAAAHGATNGVHSGVAIPPAMDMSLGGVPISVMSDSYKASHFLQYPEALKMVAYGEFRAGFNKDTQDMRFVFYGIRYLVENYISRKWTLQDIDEAALFYQTHMAPAFTSFPFPRHLFRKFVLEHNGYFPVKIEALPEGTCCHVRTPVYQVTACGEYSVLCTFLETLLTMLWYPSTVATLSRRARDVVEASFALTSDGGRDSPLVPSRLHDFGFRGCTTPEQSIVGGCAHLLNFQGSDTMSAAYYAQFRLNGGRPVAQSIPATEHSVMTAWDTERAAMENMIHHFGDGVFACVMDSYDYARALAEVLPAVAAEQVGRGGYLVLRPDSGDPVQTVLMALQAGEKVFGAATNGKGYKVIRGCGVIQGDGVDVGKMADIAAAAASAGYAADNVAYGMGGGLLQKVHRDTLSFATKLNHIVYADGRAEDVMKRPVTDTSKFSFPGVLAVQRVDGVPTVFPAEEVPAGANMLRVVYDHGPVAGCWDDFDTLRNRVATQWRDLPPASNNISAALAAKVAEQLRKGAQGPEVAAAVAGVVAAAAAGVGQGGQ